MSMSNFPEVSEAGMCCTQALCMGMECSMVPLQGFEK